MNKFSRIAKSVVIVMAITKIAYANNDASHSSLNSWTGFYVGVDGGFVFNQMQLKSHQLGFTNPDEKCTINSNFSTFSPGIQLGYMQQYPNNFVSGIETNILFNTNQKDKLNCNCPNNPNVSDRFSFRNQMQTSIKGRGGRALSWNQSILLPYLTAGASFAKTGLTYKNEGGDYYSQKNTKTGWLIGAGIEWAFRQNWSLRAEYSHVDYGNTIKLQIPTIYDLVDSKGKARADLNINSISLAISYWV